MSVSNPSFKKLFETDIRLIGPRAQNLNDNIAYRLWGRHAKLNIAQAQKDINRLCKLEKITLGPRR